MAEGKKYLFGPVPSRRLGLSLGVDIVPFKVCTLDCIYCQVGKTTEKTIERRDYVPVETVLAELKDKLSQGLTADYITLSGSGEPTLNLRLGEIVDRIKKITGIPVAILTNGTLLTDQSVRADCGRADVVLPSLDAGDQQTFEKINRPHPDISIEKLISGLCTFRSEYPGQIWLEVFFVEGVNTDSQQIAKIKDAIKRIYPDKIQLNTVVRPSTETGVGRVSVEKLQAISAQMGENCEVVADFSPQQSSRHIGNKAEDVLSMLKRRPCTLADICSGLGLGRSELLKYIDYYQQLGVIDSQEKNGTVFFKVK